MNLLKGVELLLSKEQMKQIQILFEEFTLKVDDINRDDLFLKYSNETVQAIMVMITYLEVGVVVIVNLIFQSKISKDIERFGMPFFVLEKQIQICAITISLLTLLFAWKWPLPKLMNWVFKVENTKRKLYKRFAVIVLAGFTVILVYELGLLFIAQHLKGSFFQKPSPARSFYLWGSMPMLPLITIFGVLTQAMGLLLPANKKISGFVFSKFIIVLKWMLWRVVQYDKGVVSALVLLLTIILGVMTVIFK